MDEGLREDRTAGRFVLATVIPKHRRLGRTEEEQRYEGEEKAHDNAVQKRARRARRRRGQRRPSAVIEGVNPLFFKSARVLLDSIYSSAREKTNEGIGGPLTLLVAFKVLVQIVAGRMGMELQPDVGNVLLGEASCG